MSVRLKVDTAGLERAMRAAPKVITAEVEKALRQHGEVFRREMIETRFDAPGDIGPASRLTSRTGALAGTIGYVVRGRGDLRTMRLVVFVGGGPARRYAGIQEYGGVVRGRPWLTVPLPDNLTASGIPRYKSAAALRDDPNFDTFLHRSKRGTLVIGWRKPGARVQWLWVLRRSVKLKPRLGFATTFGNEKMAADRISRVNRAIGRALLKLEGRA